MVLNVDVLEQLCKLDRHFNMNKDAQIVPTSIEDFDGSDEGSLPSQLGDIEEQSISTDSVVSTEGGAQKKSPHTFGKDRSFARNLAAQEALEAWQERPEPKEIPTFTETRYPCYDLRWFLGCCICYPPEDTVILGDLPMVVVSVKRLKRKYPTDWRARLNQRHTRYGGHTLTSLAILEANFEITEWLINNGIDIDQRDERTGLAPLHHAVRKECLTDQFAGVVQGLLDFGAQVDIRDKKGTTPLMLASLFGHVEVVKLLIERGADAEGRDKDGWCPLNYATYGGRVDVANQLVIGEGNDLALRDKYGKTSERLSQYMHEFEGRRMRHGAVQSFLEAYRPGMAQ